LQSSQGKVSENEKVRKGHGNCDQLLAVAGDEDNSAFLRRTDKTLVYNFGVRTTHKSSIYHFAVST